MHYLRRGVHQLLDIAEIFSGSSFDHVGRQGPRAAGETDKWHTTRQCTADLLYRRHNIVQISGRIWHRQLSHISFSTDSFPKPWTFTLLKVEPQPHRIRNRQNIGKQYRRIKAVAFQRLQRYLARQLGVFA
ncbi:hypothetical protein D3C85_1253880 [compost metagenome]